MATILKQGKSDLEQKEEASRIQEIVSGVIMDIENNGDAAVRRYSEKFDRCWSY